MIQARSLASLIELADNPPLSPRSDVDATDPLVLYIARVPGSRDVFLTTTKPLQKVVTAQDVQGSLYYIHVDSEDDERLRKQVEINGPNDVTNWELSESDGRSAPERPPSRGWIVATPNDPRLPSMVSSRDQNPSHRSPGTAHVIRKPITIRGQPMPEEKRAGVEAPRSNIMGPRAMNPRLASDLSSHSGPGLPRGKENAAPRRWSEQPPVVQPPLPPISRAPKISPGLGSSTMSNLLSTDEESRPSSSREETCSHRLFNYQQRSTENRALSLTLIRRYNGLQWNVGRIDTADEGENLWQQQSMTPQDDLSIRISMPGYSKFNSPEDSKVSLTPDQVFERRILRFRRRSRDQSSEECAGVPSNRASRLKFDFRRLSKPRLDQDSGPKGSELSSENKPSGTKGYGFYSPWSSICEFYWGISGHSLKCKHTPPAKGSQAVIISELRFNLPSSNRAIPASPVSMRSPGKSKTLRRSSYFSTATNGSHSPSQTESNHEVQEAEDTSDFFDLSLGQENLGGGFGGKQAKLGKLIVEPEGLQMLDLVVAANMGLWWKVYEKCA